MGMFGAFRGKVWRNSSALQTCWRSAQSGANLSLPNSLLTGKNTGNLRNFDLQKPHSFPLSYTFGRRNTSAGVNRSRELTGRYQGINLPDQGIVAGRFSGEAERWIAART